MAGAKPTDDARRVAMGRTTEERFWIKVQRRGADECWLWIASRCSDGYGTFSYKGRTVDAHRVCWMLECGPIPAGQHVLHHCDTPACVNPAHLFLGDQSANALDREKKGRGWMKRHPELMQRGSAHHEAKLTEEAASAIRVRYASGGISMKRLADEYGVSVRTVSNVVHRLVWVHVP